MMNYGWWGWGFGGALLMDLIGIAFVVLVIWAIIRLTRRGDGYSMTANRQTPLDIAKERYAKGEITKEQFEQIKKDLNQ